MSDITTPAEAPTGRLVLVMEKRLSAASRKALHSLLTNFIQQPDVTFVSGLGKAAMLSAAQAGKHIFYNTAEHLPMWEVSAMVPWREVWLISAGRVWCAQRLENPLQSRMGVVPESVFGSINTGSAAFSDR